MLHLLRLLPFLYLCVLAIVGNTQTFASTPVYKIVAEVDSVFLAQGKDRFLLCENGYWVSQSSWPFPDGRTLRIGARGEHPYYVRLFKEEREQEKVALEDGPFFLDSVTVLGDAAYAIQNQHSTFKSGEPIERQYLIRIRLRPSLALERIRELSYFPREHDYVNLPQRLFSYGSDLLVYSIPDYTDNQRIKGYLYRVAPDGKTRGIFTRLPASMYPVELVDKRWLLLAKYDPPQFEGDNRVHPMAVFDLKTRKVRVLRHTIANEIIQAYGRRFALKNQREVTIYEMPFSKPVKIYEPVQRPYYLWKDILIVAGYEGGGKKVTLYDAKTGRKFQSLSFP